MGDNLFAGIFGGTTVEGTGGANWNDDSQADWLGFVWLRIVAFVFLCVLELWGGFAIGVDDFTTAEVYFLWAGRFVDFAGDGGDFT